MKNKYFLILLFSLFVFTSTFSQEKEAITSDKIEKSELRTNNSNSTEYVNTGEISNLKVRNPYLLIDTISQEAQINTTTEKKKRPDNLK